MTSTLPPLVQAFSGAIGSSSANALVYPLDLVTTRLQLESRSHKDGKLRPLPIGQTSIGARGGLRAAIRIISSIVRNYGVKELYSGLGTDTAATLISNFFYFYFYAFLRYLSTRRRLFLRHQGTHKPPPLLEEVLMGFVAGVASRAVSTPLSVITSKLQSEGKSEDDEHPAPKASDIMKQIYKADGVPGFWRGFKTTILLSLNPALTLALFQLYRRMLWKRVSHSAGTNPSPTQAFLGAAVSNSIASSLLYPLMLAKTRLQATDATSLTSVLRDAYSGQGVPGWYQGMEMQVIKGFISQGITFLVKGRIEEIIIQLYILHQRP